MAQAGSGSLTRGKESGDGEQVAILETVLLGVARPEWHITPHSHLTFLLHRVVGGE